MISLDLRVHVNTNNKSKKMLNFYTLNITDFYMPYIAPLDGFVTAFVYFCSFVSVVYSRFSGLYEFVYRMWPWIWSFLCQ